MTDAPHIATPALDRISAALGAEWPAIRAAQRRAGETLERLRVAVQPGAAAEDTSVVVFGSLARGEVTAGSDVDWTLLVDGQAYASHLDQVQALGERLEALGLKEPGREGTFGSMTVSHGLVHHIGGEDDTNRNTTQRILLLLESRAVGDASAYTRVRRQVLRRYVLEDFGWLHGRNHAGVPRFLLNDVVRYWRTLAVDFAYKRRERRARGWALRTVKLRLSRKLTYAAGLVACYSAGAALSPQSGAAARAVLLVDSLDALLRRPPLDIVAGALEPYLADAQIAGCAAELFGAYDEFLALIDDDGRRRHLDALRPDDAATDAMYEAARAISRRFQNALTTIFFDKNATHLYELTRVYGVF